MNGFSLERRSFAIAALVLVALATASFGAVSYAGAKADERRGLSERFVQDMRAAATRAAADERLAVLAQRRRDAKLLKAAVRRIKAKAKREANRAFEKGRDEGYTSGSAAGYASGSSAGYADGSADGYDDGLSDGSDGLDCSDDIDVYWLPACP
ncbi:MAG: hypothetical protein H0X21_02780 [Actinobacteria bacterium]|nr:hypothetical protein [Actinomycetota bacterium]